MCESQGVLVGVWGGRGTVAAREPGEGLSVLVSGEGRHQSAVAVVSSEGRKAGGF